MSMSITLAIDTAADRLQLGLAFSDGRADSLVLAMRQGHAEALFPRLAELLAGNGIGHADLARIGVTTGPGSFTGLRIGLAAARGLGLALGVPVVGVPTLEAIGLEQARPLAVLLDARRGEAFLEIFGGDAASGPRLVAMEAARRLIPADVPVLENGRVDIVRLARFASTTDPASYPPEAAYVRPADAKPQEKARIERVGR